MSTMSRTEVRPATRDTMSGVLRWLAARADASIAYFHRRALVKMLHELDDRELRDIGLLRCHIEAAVEGKLRRGRR